MTLTIIVAVIMTALVIAMIWAAGEATTRTGALQKTDQAFYAAEAGAQRVQWYCSNNQMGSISSPITGTLNGYTYSTSWTTASGKYLVTSVGTAGPTVYAMSETLTPPGSVPALAVGGDFENKNINVTGDVIVGGAYSNAGSGSVTGNVTYYGSATNTGNISGTITHATGTFATIDMTALGTTLIAAAGSNTYSGPQTNKTFDFTAIAGTNKVIYVNGAVTNPTFIGAGTLYCTGDFSVNGFGTSANPVNVVTAGNATVAANVTVYGTLYAAGTWTRSKLTWTGLVYVAGATIATNNPSSSIIQTSPPWFDPRVAGSGTSSTAVSSFTGPLP